MLRSLKWLFSLTRNLALLLTRLIILLHVPVADFTCLLGITITSDLLWNTHISNTCAKARQQLGIIHRTFNQSNPDTLSHLYCCLVSPTLDYCSSVWDPHKLARILRGCSIIPSSHFTPHPPPIQWLHHSFPLGTPIARTLAHQSSFFVSSTFIWNSLPEHVIFAPSVSSFRNRRGRLCICIELLLPDPNAYSVLH